MNEIECAYRVAAETKSDINEHCPTLRRLASQCAHVTEFGTRGGVSTVALLAGRPRRLVCCDVAPAPPHLKELAADAGVDFAFIRADVLTVEIEPTDFLFIDTKHDYTQLAAELERHAHRVRRFIALHDTVTFGNHGEGGGRGLTPAIEEFLAGNPQWLVTEEYKNNNGLLVISRIEQ